MAKARAEYRAIPEFYDAEYADVAALRHDVEFLLAHIDSRGRPLDLLEIGCGTGRVAIPVAQEGHRVLGMDVDPGMISQAERARDEADVSTQLLDFTVADASESRWPDRLSRKRRFDGAFCLFNTFLALSRAEQQEQCLRSIHRILRPGGWLWLDIFNPHLELIVGSTGGTEELEPTLFHTADGRSVMRLTSLKADLVRQIQRVTFDYHWYEARRRRKARRRFEMAWIMPRELDRLLRLCGFRVEQTWGDYDGSPVGDHSPRQIVLARRT